MNSKIRKNNGTAKRLLSFALAFIMAAGLLPGMAPASRAADGKPEFLDPKESAEDAAMNTMPVYKWHRVHTQADLPNPKLGRVPVLLLWPENNKIYYANSDNDYTVSFNGDDYDACQGTEYKPDAFLPDPFNTDASNDSFFTTKPVSCWEMEMTGGTDGDNKNAKKAKFWTDNCLLRGDGDFDCGPGSRDTWTVYTKELKGDYGEGLSDARPVKVFVNKSGADVGMEFTGDKIFGWENYHYSYDSYVMYWAEPVMVSAITADYTIGEGMVMNVKNGVILKDGVTLTVMPGGTLSIEGQFYQNGVIKNYGTVILQPDACITGFLPQNKDSGAIYNSGEEVNTKKSTEDLLKKKENERTDLETQIRTDNQTAENLTGTINLAEQTMKSLLMMKDENDASLQLRLDRKQEELEEAESRLIRDTAQKFGLTVSKDATDAEITAQIQEYLKPLSEAEAQEKQKLIDQTLQGRVDTLTGEYEALYEPVGDQQEIIDNGQEELRKIEERRTRAESEIEMLSKQIEVYKEYLNNSATKVRGEGNLLVMKNARLVLNKTEQSRLTIVDGGSCVCSGYIIHPSSILLRNAKLHIRSTGAVMMQYALEKNILNAKELTVSNPGTLNVSLNGMAGYDSLVSNCVVAEDDYVIKVDGVFRYNKKPIYNATKGEIEGIIEGSGSWNTDNAPQTYTDSEGSRVTIENDGSRSVVKKDGTVILTDARGVETTMLPGGIVIVKQKDGTSLESHPNGGYIKRFADGTIESMHVILENGAEQIYSKDQKAIVTTYENCPGGVKPGTDDVNKTLTYDDSGRSEDFHANSDKRECYNPDGSLYYTFEPQPGGGKLYTYADHTEQYDFFDRLVGADYFDGEMKGASIVRSDLLSIQENAGGQILWTVTAVNGEKTVCRLMQDLEGHASSRMTYYVWRFENGRTCTIESDNLDPRLFLYGSNLLAAPLEYTYDKTNMDLPKSETRRKSGRSLTLSRENGGEVYYTFMDDTFNGPAYVKTAVKNLKNGRELYYDWDVYYKYYTEWEVDQELWYITDRQGIWAKASLVEVSNGKKIRISFRGGTQKDVGLGMNAGLEATPDYYLNQT